MVSFFSFRGLMATRTNNNGSKLDLYFSFHFLHLFLFLHRNPMWGDARDARDTWDAREKIPAAAAALWWRIDEA